MLTTQASQIGPSVTYTGRQYDVESGLYYFRSRCSHSALGLFVRRDIDYHDGLNFYSMNFAVNNTDPTGKGGVIIGIGIAAGIGIGAAWYYKDRCPYCFNSLDPVERNFLTYRLHDLEMAS